MSRFSIDCQFCGSLLFGRTMEDARELLETHEGTCRNSGRNETLAFGFPIERKSWAESITVEDARLLHSLRIDPL